MRGYMLGLMAFGAVTLIGIALLALSGCSL